MKFIGHLRHTYLMYHSKTDYVENVLCFLFALLWPLQKLMFHYLSATISTSAVSVEIGES